MQSLSPTESWTRKQLKSNSHAYAPARNFALQLFSFLLLILVFARSSPASADQPYLSSISTSIPLVRTGAVPIEEAVAYAATSQRELLSVSSDFVPEEMTERIGRLLARAQEAWLAGSTIAAGNLFSQITALSLMEDWREAERETIAYAYMRRAQIAANPSMQDEILKALAIFHHRAELDASLFPPPLLNRFSEISTALAQTVTTINLKSIFGQARFVRINGVRWDLDASEVLHLVPGQYRVSVFSDSTESFSRVMSLDQILSFTFVDHAAIQGTCEAPNLDEGAFLHGASFDALFPHGCIRTRAGNEWQPLPVKNNSDQPQADNTAAKKDQIPQQIPDEWLPHPEDRTMPEGSLRQNESWGSRKTWLWIGATALVAAAAYGLYESQHHTSTTVQPTHGSIQ